MKRKEKAFIIAAIDIKIESDKRKKKEIEQKANMKGR